VAIQLECISLIIPIWKIDQHYPGGFRALLADKNIEFGNAFSHDEHLYREGAMDSMITDLQISDWEKFGLVPMRRRKGKPYWNDLCVATSFDGPTYPCDWLEYDRDEGTVSFKHALEVDLLPYYVYELRDPRNNRTFYVGKGKNHRIFQHRPAGQTDSDNDDVCNPQEESRKQALIREIQDECQRDCHRVVIGRFETEAEAFAVEASLIKWVYGIDNLTNSVHGHRHKNIRDHRQQGEMFDLEEKNQCYPSEPGLDVPKRVPGERDMSGKYTEEQRRKIADNAIFEKLEALRDELCAAPALSDLLVSAPNMSTPQDPCLIVSGFHPEAIRLMIKLQLTGDYVRFNLIPKSSRQNDIAAFKAVLSADDRGVFEVKNGTAFRVYGKMLDLEISLDGKKRGVQHTDVNDIVAIIEYLIDKLNGCRPN